MCNLLTPHISSSHHWGFEESNEWRGTNCVKTCHFCRWFLEVRSVVGTKVGVYGVCAGGTTVTSTAPKPRSCCWLPKTKVAASWYASVRVTVMSTPSQVCVCVFDSLFTFLGWKAGLKPQKKTFLFLSYYDFSIFSILTYFLCKLSPFFARKHDFVSWKDPNFSLVKLEKFFFKYYEVYFFQDFNSGIIDFLLEKNMIFWFDYYFIFLWWIF